VLVGIGTAAVRSRARGATGIEPAARRRREEWTMPPAALLSRPRFSPARKAALLALGGYMVVALVMLIVKAVQLAGG
jgi:hypothetical protein